MKSVKRDAYSHPGPCRLARLIVENREVCGINYSTSHRCGKINSTRTFCLLICGLGKAGNATE